MKNDINGITKKPVSQKPTQTASKKATKPMHSKSAQATSKKPSKSNLSALKEQLSEMKTEIAARRSENEQYTNIGGKTFYDIGNKIMKLATVEWAIGVLISIFAGLILMVTGLANEAFMAGFLVLLGGLLVTWITSALTYGFGKLVHNSTIIAQHYEKNGFKL